MIVVRICLKGKSDEVAQLTNLLELNMQETSKFEGCERFQVFRDIQDENGFVLYEEWQSQECLNAYQTSPYFKEIGGKLIPLIADKPDAAYFDATPIQ